MRALLLAMILVACGHARGARSIDRSSDSNLACIEDPSRSANPERPTREQCVQVDTHVEGLTHTACGERGHLFAHEGARTPSPDEQVKLLEAHRKDIHAFPGVTSSGYGVCCSEGGPKAACIRVALDLCTTKPAEVARAFASWVPSDAQMYLLVELSGATGPRCNGKKGPCGPTPYTGVTLAKAGYRCDERRDPIAPKLAWGKCAHDGECSVAGCGNQCVPWTESNLIGTCEGYTHMESAPAYCGCLRGECSWFVQ